jgi:diguanylate cyclase (GGDEF)-like protein
LSAEHDSTEADLRIAALRAAAEAMARGELRPPLPAVTDSAEADEVDRLGVALWRLGAELERRFAEATALVRLGEKVNAGLLLDEVLDQVFESFRSVFPYDRIGCSMLEDDGRFVRSVWARSVRGETRLGVGYCAPLAGSSLAHIIETGRPRIINDLREYLREHPQSESTRVALDDGIRSSLTCPLVAQGKRVGFVFFSSHEPGTYSERHVELLMMIAGQLSLVVEKGRLYADLLQTKTELEAANQTLSQVARIDGLTGVPNRRSMDEMLDLAWRRAVRHRLPVSVILIDIDHFKDFNDRYGHVEGDACLQRVATAMRAALRRPDDFIARYGGEEFLAFPSASTVEMASQLAEQLRERVEGLSIVVPDSSEPVRVTISAGVAGVEPASGGSIVDLIGSADRALYSAKGAGRNRVVCAPPHAV